MVAIQHCTKITCIFDTYNGIWYLLNLKFKNVKQYWLILKKDNIYNFITLHWIIYVEKVYIYK